MKSKVRNEIEASMAQTEIAYYEETSTVTEPEIIYYELTQEEVPGWVYYVNNALLLQSKVF